ncbi:MAG: outer membrane protein transport protein [Ignavibacteria bacterium]
MKKVILVFLTLFIVTSASIFSNGLSLNSVGARALGMGGAFVGLANDYSTIYWNPAGIGQLKGNYIGVFSTDVIPLGTFKSEKPYVNTKTEVNHYISPNLMGYIGFEPLKDFTFGFGVYVPAGLGAEWNGADMKAYSMGQEMIWKSKIAVVNISPAVSYKFSDDLSAGIAVNIFYGMFDLSRPETNDLLGVGQYKESSTGLGYGITVGALYKVNDMLSIGASVRTKTKVTMSGNASNTLMPRVPLQNIPETTDFDRDVAWPLWIAGGIAIRPMPEWVITVDVQLSQWSKSETEFDTKFKNEKWVSLTTPTGKNKFILNWKDATQFRLGSEYILTKDFTVRGGFYIDPAPAPDETYNILFPSISYNGVAVGASYSFSSFTIDAGYEYLFGKDRVITTASDTKYNGTHGMDIPAVSLGIGYNF